MVVVAIIFGFFYFYRPASQTTGTAQGTNFLANFLPFGTGKTTTPTSTTTPVNVSGYVPPVTTTEVANTSLKKVSSFPVAGFGVFMKERFKDVANPTLTLPLSGDGSNTVPPAKGGSGGLKTTTPKPTAPLTEFAPALRYVEKATGNIYETFADSIDERKFSSTIIPKVYDAYFGNTGQSVVMRYLKDDNKTIETFVGVIPKEYLGADSSVANEITGSFLPENISDISVSPDTSKIFYLFDTGNSIAGVTLNLQTNTKVQVFDSPFTEWLSSWPNSKMITITTKPSVNEPGYVYAVNPDNQDLTKVLGGIKGMTTLTSPDGKMVLYGDNSLSLNVFDTDTGSSSLLGVKTLPEKCVWGSASDVVYCAVPKSIAEGDYPDSWYQGEVSFNDQIWKIDVKSGNTTMIADPFSTNGEDVDAIKLGLDGSQNYLFFINKKDSYLWELNLK